MIVYENALLVGKRRAILLHIVFLEGGPLVVVRHYKRVQWFIVLRGCWSVDGQRAEKAIRVLQTVVAVVPRCAILSGIEDVRVILSRGDGTLRNSRYPVNKVAVQQSKPMKMDCSPIFDLRQVVVDSDFFLSQPTIQLRKGGRYLLTVSPQQASNASLLDPHIAS